MFCVNCGTQLPDDANFCGKCGTPQKSGSRIGEGPTGTKWETCEIVREEAVPSNWTESFTNALSAMVMNPDPNKARFVKYIAKAVGVAGVYVAGEAKGKFDKGDRDSRSAVQSVETLVGKLAKDGWEPMGKGEQWYNYKFKRPVRTK